MIETNDSSGAGSASGLFPDLNLAIHSVLITNEYTDTYSAIILATASTNVDLTSGSEIISFVAINYNLSSHDEDGGGCVIDFSTIDNCTLE